MNVPYNKAPNSSHICAEWYERYFNTKPEGIGTAPEGSTDIYITTFGNKWFVEYQIETLRKFFLSPFNIIIVDTNQNLHPEISTHLLEICTREKVIYLKAPDNHYQEKQFFDSTMKLGTTLSFLFHNVVKFRKPRHFGFLDHDCFLFRPTTIHNLMRGKDIYGTVCRNIPKWNLHVITNFFEFKAVEHLPLDFRASYRHGLDTGGANYDILYAGRNMEDYVLSHIGVRYMEEDISLKDRVQHYEVIDNRWMHMCASTHDLLAGDPGGEKKMLYTKGFLDAVLRV